jgi:hypothetical protein
MVQNVNPTFVKTPNAAAVSSAWAANSVIWIVAPNIGDF